MPLKTRLGRVLDALFELQLRIAMLSLCVMMLVVVADVFMRYVFNAPVRGSYDMVGFCLVVMVSFGLARVISDRSEILIDLIDALVPAIVVRGLSLFVGAATTSVLLFIFWSMFKPALSAYSYGDRSLELNLPIWIIWAIALFGILGAVIAAISVTFVPHEHRPGPVEGEGSTFE